MTTIDPAFAQHSARPRRTADRDPLVRGDVSDAFADAFARSETRDDLPACADDTDPGGGLVDDGFDAEFETAFATVVEPTNEAAAAFDVDLDIEDECVLDHGVAPAAAAAGDIDIDIDIDIAIVDLDVDGLIASRVTSREVVPLDVGVARVNDAVAGGASLGEITRLVERDPALAANVGRLARSAAFTSAVGERVSLPYSIMRLGVNGVRGVCLMSSLAKEAMRPGPLLPLRRQVWRECLASALTCQAIASFHGVSGDEAWLLGLVHDFGKVVALTAIEPDVDGDAPLNVPFWSDVMERHHCDVGWIVTDRWKLPKAIPFVTATHHQHSAGKGLHEVVVRADRVVAAAARRGWQIAAADIAAIEGVDSDDEAMAIRIALAKHPFYLAAIS